MTLEIVKAQEIPALTIEEVESLQALTRARLGTVRVGTFEGMFLADVAHALRDLHATLAPPAAAGQGTMTSLDI